MGDFNETLDLEDHSSHEVNPMVTQEMRDFNEIVQYFSLLDIASHGPCYTWCNKRSEGLVLKKLDRVLFNDSWLTAYPQSYAVLRVVDARIIFGVTYNCNQSSLGQKGRLSLSTQSPV